LAAAIRRLNVRCDLVPQDLLQIVRRDADAVKRLRREYEARRAAGLDHSWLTPAALAREAAIEGGGAIRTRGFAFDPFRACVGFAAAAVERGAEVFERTPVRRVRAKRKLVEVTTATGTVRGQAVVIATGAPLPDLRALRRHLSPQQGYAVVTEPLPAAVRRELGRRAASVTDAGSPPHFLRWLKDDRALFAGADQGPVPVRGQEKMLVQRTGQLMYELSTIYPDISGILPAYGWESSYAATAEGLPYIGPHRNFPFHLFAFGDSSHSVTGAYLASRVLLRHHLDDLDASDSAFSFTR
jgi:glycine/D-amino acid oxidase-like deaminating enzyme